MLDRRRFLISTSAMALAGGTLPALAAGKADKLDSLLDAFIAEQLDLSPEFSTILGLDVGARAHQRGELSDGSYAGAQKRKSLTKDQLKRLGTIDRKALKGFDALNYDSVAYGLKQEDTANDRFAYGKPGAGNPYVVNQLDGAYHELPDFFANAQPVESATDAEAYLSRLALAGKRLDDETAYARHDQGLGVVPPDFAITRAIEQMKALRAVPADQSVMVQSLSSRAKEKGIAIEAAARAERIVADTLYPALDRQIAYYESLLPLASHDAGVWKLPDGEAYYAAALEGGTTTTMSPAEVHKLGLEVVADCTRQADAIMKTHGLSKGSVGERLRAMFQDAKFLYPNTDEGKEKLIHDLNDKLAAVKAQLPKYFDTLPKADIEIKRVPKFIEAGAPGGYYNAGSLDGKRPGIYYINLRDSAEVPSWTLPTLTYHEAIPGHHMQISIAQETKLPLIRKVASYNAYVEGWALYAEQLAVEMGMYKDDPFGHIGMLHDAMLRGVRLVVDSGMHAMKWTREQALRYYVDHLGDPESAAATEIERYAVWPGQACGYMVGKITLLSLRDKAKKALGKRFDIRHFHDAILLNGALPLKVLEKNVIGGLPRH